MNINHSQNYSTAVNFGTISPRFKEALPRMPKYIQDSVSRCSDIIEKSKVVKLDVDMEKSSEPFLEVLEPLKNFLGNGKDVAKGAIIKLCGSSNSMAKGSNIEAKGIQIIQDEKETIHDITFNLGKDSSIAAKKIVYKIFDFGHGYSTYDKVSVLGSLIDISHRVRQNLPYEDDVKRLYNACKFGSKEALCHGVPTTIIYGASAIL